MSIKKQYLKNKSVCKVTFTLPKDMVDSVENVSLVGDFNDWNTEANPMKHRKDGAFEATVNLEKGHEYQFRYLLDGRKWENDNGADRYVRSPYGDAENSIVVV
jgi:1,4-alpha-glucan branching enzyme